jgi:outer membrane protein OmpA-like peptidoglycan-associated protein
MRISIFIIFLSLICSNSVFATESNYLDPDDPDTINASEAAVSALGPTHGAMKLSSFEGIPIKSTSLQIIAESVAIAGSSRSVGGSGISLKTDIRDAEKTMSDLGAKKTDIGYELSLSGDVLFDFDKWDIKPEAEELLSRLADALKKMGEKDVAITGHTDSIGSNSYNLNLSNKRAESVKTWLAHKGGVKMARFSVRGMGKSKPVAPNTFPDGKDNPEGRAKNRRVEFFIKSNK